MQPSIVVLGLVICALVGCTSPPADAYPQATAASPTDTASLPFGPCPWGGAWRAELRRGAQTTSGTLDVRDSAGRSRTAGTPGVSLRRWRGRYAINTAPLFGPGEGSVRSSSAGDGTPEEIQFGVELEPWGDSVSISLQPLVSHGPLSLWGARHGDSISGEWVQRTGAVPVMPGGPDPTPRGTFALVRTRGCVPA